MASSRSDAQGIDQIWIFDLGRGLASRLTLDAADNYAPVWSPDGSELFFTSNREGVYDIFRQAINGAGGARRVAQSSSTTYPLDISPDGRFLLYWSGDPVTQTDVWLLSLSGGEKPAPLLQTPFDETGARVSPDGRFMAYSSNESGRYEIYVQAFPTSSGKAGVDDGRPATGVAP